MNNTAQPAIMHEIARSLIILQPKQPFLDWLNVLGVMGDDLSLNDVSQDPDAILIPEFESKKEALVYVQTNAESLFTHALEDWCTDRSLWPPIRDFETLCRWFDIITHSLVFDAVGDGNLQWEHN